MCIYSFLKSLDIFDLDISKRQTQEGYSNFSYPREETSFDPHLSLHYDLQKRKQTDQLLDWN